MYPLLVDAYVELGEYALAEEAAQRMLDLGPDYVPGLARAAYLRELFGDLDGSLELLVACLRARTPESEAEQRAWYSTHIGHVQRLLGRLDEAGRAAEAALEALPDYHYALAVLSDVRADQGRLEEALALARRHVDVAPHPENRVRVGQLLARLGRGAEARAAFAEFEAGARAESAGTDNANRELALHLADEGGDPKAALQRRGARTRPPPRRVHAGGPCLGAPSQRATRRGARGDRAERSRWACAIRASSIARARSRSRRATTANARRWLEAAPRRFRARGGRDSRARSCPRSGAGVPGSACSRFAAAVGVAVAVSRVDDARP